MRVLAKHFENFVWDGNLGLYGDQKHKNLPTTVQKELQNLMSDL